MNELFASGENIVHLIRARRLPRSFARLLMVSIRSVHLFPCIIQVTRTTQARQRNFFPYKFVFPMTQPRDIKRRICIAFVRILTIDGKVRVELPLQYLLSNKASGPMRLLLRILNGLSSHGINVRASILLNEGQRHRSAPRLFRHQIATNECRSHFPRVLIINLVGLMVNRHIMYALRPMSVPNFNGHDFN